MSPVIDATRFESPAQFCARRDHDESRGKLVLSYEVVVLENGQEVTRTFRSPVLLRVESGADSLSGRWDGEWFSPLWGVMPACPRACLVGTQRLFVRGRAFARDLRSRPGAVVSALAEPVKGAAAVKVAAR
jgi:hypothetical protein